MIGPEMQAAKNSPDQMHHNDGIVNHIINQSLSKFGGSGPGFSDKVVKQIQVEQNKHIKKLKAKRVQREPLILQNHLEKIEQNKKLLEEEKLQQEKIDALGQTFSNQAQMQQHLNPI